MRDVDLVCRGLSPQLGAGLATANYVGYLAGALAAIVLPGLVGSRAVLRVSLVVLAASLALMPATHAGDVWLVLRDLHAQCSGAEKRASAGRRAMNSNPIGISRPSPVAAAICRTCR